MMGLLLFSVLVFFYNIGERNMQELFFLAGDETVCVLNVFIFVTEKSITFIRTKVSQEGRKKTNLSELTQIFCGLLSSFLNTSQ